MVIWDVIFMILGCHFDDVGVIFVIHFSDIGKSGHPNGHQNGTKNGATMIPKAVPKIVPKIIIFGAQTTNRHKLAC